LSGSGVVPMPINAIHLSAELVGLGPTEAKLLRDAGAVLAPQFSSIIDRFYERLMTYEPLREIVAKHTTTSRLKGTLRHYLVQIFSGDFDEQYAHERVNVGLTHDRVNLPLIWYLGMFSVLEHMVFDAMQPHYENKLLKEWISVQNAVSKLIKFDQLLAVDAYVTASFSRLEEQTAHAQKARKSKSIFLATVSHELRTPLSSILGYSDLILDTAGEISPQTRQYLQILRRNAEALLAMINELIEIGRVDSGKAASDVRLGSLKGLLDEVAADAKGLVNSRPVKIECPYRDKPDLQVRFDFAKLRQILINIIGNACKYTDSGAVTIDVSSDQGEVAISIADTGPGIPEEYRARVFDEFFRIQGNKKPGSGLGLSLVKILVDSVQGSIAVESNHPRGARFILRIRDMNPSKFP
jgi:signal transduction histidine kinase